jgi:hypothetical protein
MRARVAISRKGKQLITVVGAMSKQGRSVAQTLLQSGRYRVRAPTRARDVLIVPAIGDDSTGHGPALADHWWVQPLYSALYPPKSGDSVRRERACVPTLGLTAY